MFRKLLFKCLSLIAFLLLYQGWAYSQTYSLARFNSENGLPDQYVYAIVQDARGFMYVGTGAGIFQYNGQQFKKLGKDNGFAEDFNTISLKDSKNQIWFGHFEGGLTRLKGNKFESVLDSNLLNSSINGLVEDKNGNIWISAQRNGLVCLDSTLKTTTYATEFQDYMVTSLALADENKILVGTDAGVLICSISGTKLKVEGKAAGIPPTRIQSILKRPKKKNVFWVGTEDEGIFELSLGSETGSETVLAFGAKEGWNWPNVSALYEEQDGKLWAGIPGNGFLTFEDRTQSNRLRRIMPTKSSDTLATDIVKCIYQDRFGQIWLGTYGQGLICLSKETFSTIHLDLNGIEDEVNVTIEDKSGNFWFGTPNGLFFAPKYSTDDFGYTYTISSPIKAKPTKAYRSSDGLPSNDVTALMEDKEGLIWIGTRQHGIAYLDPLSSKIVPVELTEFALSKSVHAIIQDKRQNIWIATTDGAFRHHHSTGENAYFSTRNGLAHNNISNIFEDSKGRIWFITHTNRITLLNGKDFQLLTVTKNGEVPNVNCIAEDKEGNIWLGSDGLGLYRFDGNQFQSFNESNGLLSNYIYLLNFDRYGNLWLAHRKGFTRFIPETGKFIPYPNKAMLRFDENQVHASTLDRKGNIWYSSSKGAIRYNWIPARSANQAPYTFISSIEIPGYEGEITDGIQLPYDSYRIRINYLGLTFLDQASVRYQYKIEGFADDWSDPSESPGFTLQGLPDGDFTFMVRACNAMGKCNDVPAKFKFSILPPFWKTWWFRILVVLLAAAGIYGYVRYRTYRLNLEKAVLEEKIHERTRELQAEKEKVEHANLELEKLSLVASKTDNAVFILDKDGMLEWVNDGFMRLTGYTLAEFYDFLPHRNLLLSSYNPEIRTLLENSFTKTTTVQYESQLPTRSGDYVWVISTLTTVHDEKGQLRKIIIIDSDISERKKAEEAVRRLNTELEALVAARTEALRLENAEHIKTAERLRVINQELDTFVYRASHDLKGPLASLLGLISIAIGELEDVPNAIKYLALMERAGRRLDQILIDLIEATQVKQGVVEISEVEIEPVVRQVIESLASLPDYPKVKFDLRIEPGLKVSTDPKLLTAILTNYINNTIKYSDTKKGECSSMVEIGVKDGKLEIRVSDNGLGIQESLQSRVFDMFFRGTKHGGGSGLGLYIVAQAAEKLGGSVGMESKEGQGSTFTASLPVGLLGLACAP